MPKEDRRHLIDTWNKNLELRFKFRCLLSAWMVKKAKKNEITIQNYTTLEDPNPANSITWLDMNNRCTYRIDGDTLLKSMSMYLLNSSFGSPEPLWPKNPNTNIPLTHGQLVHLFFELYSWCGKNKKKIPKMTASQLSALFRVSAPKYKRHSDDPRRPDPEIEDSGDEKSSEASASSSSSSSSSASSTIASPVSRRKSSSKTHNLIVLDESNCWGGGSASSSKHKKSGLSGGGGLVATSAAKMAVGKIAEALSSYIIAAAASKYKKKSADIIKRRREQEDDDEEEFSESEDDDEECSEEESGEESEENSDEDSEAAEDSDDDDDESDDSDSDYDDDEDEDDDDSEFDDDDSSEGDDERTQKKNKKKQAAMEEQCAKNRQKLADIKSAIQKMTELSASDAMTSNKFMKKQIEEMKQKEKAVKAGPGSTQLEDPKNNTFTD
jgi:hypothetical protein